MTLPEVKITPPNDYYEGDRIELECTAKGNPRPTITWQRTKNRALPIPYGGFSTNFIIENARVEDSGEYR